MFVNDLQFNPRLAGMCGFDHVPSESTFSRFFKRLANHTNLVEDLVVSLVDQCRELLDDFGQEVAVDSTAIDAYCNTLPVFKKRDPGRPKKGDEKKVSDPEAAKGKRHVTYSSDMQWFFGYKFHVLCDANYDLPIAFTMTPGNKNDSKLLPPVFRKAKEKYSWFSPELLLADKGYEGRPNADFLCKEGTIASCR